MSKLSDFIVKQNMNDLTHAETSGRGDYMMLQKAKESVVTPSEGKDIFEITGNSYSILKYRRHEFDSTAYKYLKITVVGNQTKNFSYGCLYFFIGMIVLFLFPLFFLFTDCLKRKIQRLYSIDLNVYETIGQIIAAIKPKECYLVVEDSYFNESKCRAITRGLEISYTNKFQFVNTSEGINTYGHNYSDFPLYARQWKNAVSQARIRWDRKAV